MTHYFVSYFILGRNDKIKPENGFYLVEGAVLFRARERIVVEMQGCEIRRDDSSIEYSNWDSWGISLNLPEDKVHSGKLSGIGIHSEDKQDLVNLAKRFDLPFSESNLDIIGEQV